MQKRFQQFTLLWILFATGCGTQTTPSVIQPTVIQSEQNYTPTESAIPTIPASPTAVLDYQVELAEKNDSTTNTDLTPAPDPLRIIFPSSAPAAVSAWRPPLYPIPWVPTLNDHFYFARPIAANEINWPLPDYRYGGVFLPEVVHTGIDIPAPIGTPVLAAGSGRVVWAGYGLYLGEHDPTDPYGLAVTIKHDFGFQGETLYSVYGHLDQIDIQVGQNVETGEVVGSVGQTGKVTGPHLHFEVRLGKNDFFVSRNPELWIAPPQGWGVLVGRVMNTTGYLLESYTIKVQSRDNLKSWKVNTYGHGVVVSDSYYRENMVLGDLPAGEYVVLISFAGANYDLPITISPGMVSYFTFRGKNGYKTTLPASPDTAFIPPDSVTATP